MEPRHERSQPPTREPDDTAKRLDEKMRRRRGEAGRERTAERIREVAGGSRDERDSPTRG